MKQPFKPTPTGAVPHTVEGVKFYTWHVGIMRYERRAADGRIVLRSNSVRMTSSAWVDGECIGNRFRSDLGAAKAAVKHMQRKDRAGVA